MFNAIWNFIKDFFQVFLLRNRVSKIDSELLESQKELIALELKVTSLEAERDDLLACSAEKDLRINDLENQIERLTEQGRMDNEMHPSAQKILLAFRHTDQSLLTKESLRQITRLDSITFDHCFEQLESNKYLIYDHRDILEGCYYELTAKGRKYLLDRAD